MNMLKNSRKSQIVIFIILGIAVLVAAGLLFYIVASTAQQRSSSQLEQQRLAAELVQPVDAFVTACLKSVSESALLLIGMQGGLINPTNFIQYTEDGKVYKVNYGITMGAGIETGLYFSDPPKYPKENFPNFASLNPYGGYFGDLSLPTEDIIKPNLENYILNNISSCLTEGLDSFRQTGIDVLPAEQKTVSVEIGESSVSFKLDWQMKLTAQNRVTTIDSFVVSQPVRLGKIKAFAEYLVGREIGQANYEISGKSSEGIFSTIAASHIVALTDPTYPLSGKPFKFLFAMQNRPPALHKIISINYCNAPGAEKIFFNGADILIKKYSGSIIIQRTQINSTDPDDGDAATLTFNAKYMNNNPIPVAGATLSGIPLLNISVTDSSGKTDYQENIQVKNTGIPCPP